MPRGFLPLQSRLEIAHALGADDDLAIDTGATAVGDDPDYVFGRGDSLVYKVPLADMPAGARSASVMASLSTTRRHRPSIFRIASAQPRVGMSSACASWSVSVYLNLTGTAADGWRRR